VRGSEQGVVEARGGRRVSKGAGDAEKAGEAEGVGALATSYAWQARELQELEAELNDMGTSVSCHSLTAAQEMALDAAFRVTYPMPGGPRRRHETAAALRQWFRNRRMFFNYAGTCTKSLPQKLSPSVAKAKFDSWMLFRKK